MPPNQIRAFILKRVRTPNAISNIEIGGPGGRRRVIFVGGVAGVYFSNTGTRNEVRWSHYLHDADDTAASTKATWIGRSQTVQYDEDEHKHNDGNDHSNYNSDDSNHHHDHGC